MEKQRSVLEQHANNSFSFFFFCGPFALRRRWSGEEEQVTDGLASLSDLAMNLAGGGAGGNVVAVHSYSPAKRSHNAQASTELRELTNTLQDLNEQFKRNVKVLSEIKDFIVKMCEKQETRPVDDNAGVHKLERVRSSSA